MYNQAERIHSFIHTHPSPTSTPVMEWLSIGFLWHDLARPTIFEVLRVRDYVTTLVVQLSIPTAAETINSNSVYRFKNSIANLRFLLTKIMSRINNWLYTSCNIIEQVSTAEAYLQQILTKNPLEISMSATLILQTVWPCWKCFDWLNRPLPLI